MRNSQAPTFILGDDNDDKEEPPAKKSKKQCAPAKNWVFTDHDASVGRQAAWKLLLQSSIKRLAFQIEICPKTKKEHIQGAFELKKKARPTTFMRGPHYEKQKGTDAEAVNYATKAETRKPGTEPFVYGYPKPVEL